MSTPRIARRDWFKLAAAGLLGPSGSGWLPVLADRSANDPKRKRSCILLWMSGGPSQMDTFDLKPGHANGGPFKETQTSAPGLRFSEHLPKLAMHGDRLAVLRSVSTAEGDHGRATFLLRTGYQPTGPIRYPSLGSIVSHELGDPDAALPNCVSIAPYRFFNPSAFGPGYLGPRHAPMVVGEAKEESATGSYDYASALKVQDLDASASIKSAHAAARLELLREMEAEFGASRPGPAAQAHAATYDQAVRLMTSEGKKAFDLEQERADLRDRYGRNLFGQGCLLARRLVERGVPFVEVTLGGLNGGGFGWDSHANNFESVKRLSAVLDQGWAALLGDLKDRGLLDSTLIVWMGEFGRTPNINQSNGRDHYPAAWSVVFGGGGVKGGQAVGKTSKDGGTVEERKVGVPAVLATICAALGIDGEKQLTTNVGRPLSIVEKGTQPIEEIVA